MTPTSMRAAPPCLPRPSARRQRAGLPALVLALALATVAAAGPATGPLPPDPLPEANPVTAACRIEIAAAAIARRDPMAAVGYLRPLLATPRGSYLLSQLGRYLAGTGKLQARRRPDALGVATACHNLFLFLRGEGLSATQARPWADEAIGLYRKAMATLARGKRTFARGACAGLLAELGRRSEADRLLARFDPRACDPEDRAMLCAYVECAFGHRERALALIREAIAQDRKAAALWLAVSDDFHGLAKDPELRAIRLGLEARER